MTCMRMTEAHLLGVAALEQECFGEPWSEKSLALLCSEAAVGVVCTDDGGRVLGYGGMLWAPEEGQITNLAVTASHRREGIGARLLKALLTHAEANQCREVSLEVRASNVAAIALYAAHGFFEAGRRRGFYRAPVEDAIVMLCKLPDRQGSPEKE